jgi:AcrR family transcriptional regulator
MGGAVSVTARTQRHRTRDPARKQRIVAAAVDLVARRGYSAVGMADIGAAAGVTASAIYRHFDSKSAVLAAVFDGVIDRLLSNAARIVAEAVDDTAALSALIDDQVSIALEDRDVLQVYMREITSLPEEDRRRLRRKQRLYLEEWVHLVCELRTDLGDAEARALVHSAIGAIQSVLNYDSTVPADRLAPLLSGAARAVLGIAGPAKRSR